MKISINCLLGHNYKKYDTYVVKNEESVLIATYCAFKCISCGKVKLFKQGGK